jgi:uncharacterized membrane protein YbhN (UPF0104 family)
MTESPQQRKEHKVVASTSKKIEEERSFDKLLRERDQENIKRFEGANKFSHRLISYFVILGLAFYYFYQVFTKPDFSLGFWGYVLIIVIAVATLDVVSSQEVLSFFEDKKEDSGKKFKKVKISDINSQYPQSSFDDFIAGRMSLAKCFWLYHVLIGFVLSFLCAYFAETYEQYWLYIFPLAYYAVVTVAVWNCATLYSKQKLENKQPYGWAIATKIFISLNAIVLVAQIFIMLSTK